MGSRALFLPSLFSLCTHTLHSHTTLGCHLINIWVTKHWLYCLCQTNVTPLLAASTYSVCIRQRTDRIAQRVQTMDNTRANSTSVTKKVSRINTALRNRWKTWLWSRIIKSAKMIKLDWTGLKIAYCCTLRFWYALQYIKTNCCSLCNFFFSITIKWHNLLKFIWILFLF